MNGWVVSILIALTIFVLFALLMWFQDTRRDKAGILVIIIIIVVVFVGITVAAHSLIFGGS